MRRGLMYQGAWSQVNTEIYFFSPYADYFQRIEQHWSVMHKNWTRWWRNFFWKLEEEFLFNGSKADKYVDSMCTLYFLSILICTLYMESVSSNVQTVVQCPLT